MAAEKAVKTHRKWERGVSRIEHLKMFFPVALPWAKALMSRYIIHPNAFVVYFLVIVVCL